MYEAKQSKNGTAPGELAQRTPDVEVVAGGRHHTADGTSDKKVGESMSGQWYHTTQKCSGEVFIVIPHVYAQLIGCLNTIQIKVLNYFCNDFYLTFDSVSCRIIQIKE